MVNIQKAAFQVRPEKVAPHVCARRRRLHARTGGAVRGRPPSRVPCGFAAHACARSPAPARSILTARSGERAHACVRAALPRTRASVPSSHASLLTGWPLLQRDFVLAVKAFEWIGGRPLDTIGEPAELDTEPEVLALLQIFLNNDGDEDRIPPSQQVSD